MPFRILIADDDELALETARFNLASEADLQLETATSAEAAIALVKAEPTAFALILLDLRMPEMSGSEAARALLAINPNLIIAINSGDYSREALKDCFASGVVDFIEKDTPASQFREKIRAFCRKFEETAQVFSSPKREEKLSSEEEEIASIGMIGRSTKLAEVARLVKQAAPTDCGILIEGESGTGKELVARAFHRLSHRRQKPFIAINVAAIPDNLLESDLFGHERGAFTGADRAKVGKFLLADGGTLFLDEIGEMKLELQAKLLRAIQEGEILPVGALRPLKVNLRIVAATHVDLETAVREKRFREDLYYRLNVLKVRLPALRERAEDVQPLVAHFLDKFAGQSGQQKTLLMKTVRYLERYPWPGNVRELENEMEKIVAIVPSQKIEPQHLSGKFFAESKLGSSSSFDCSYEDFMSGLEQKERQYIENHLRRGSIREAAKHHMRAPLGTIYGRMKKLGIQYEQKREIK